MAKRREKGDGSIYQRESDGRYVAYARLPDGKKKYVYDKTRSGVAKKLKELRMSIDNQTLILAKPETVEIYLKNWLASKTRIKETTYHNYKWALGLATPHIGHIFLTKLSGDHLVKLYAILAESHRNKSLVLVHTVLKLAFRDAIKRKKLNSNPCSEIDTPRKPDEKKYEATALSADQCQKLIDAAKGTTLECFIVFALATAMRRGELLGLRWSDIDMTEKTVSIQRTASYLPDPQTGVYRFIETTPKSESSQRIIPLTDFALVALKAHKIKQVEMRLQSAAWQDMDLVFPSPRGDWYRSNTLQFHFKKIVRLAGVPDICIHELRHSTATLLRRKGVDVKTVQIILGHANYTTTANIYEHVLMEDKEDAMIKLDKVFRKDS